MRVSASEIPSRAGKPEHRGHEEDRVEDNLLPSELQKTFEEVEYLAQRTGVLGTAGGLGKATRAFIDAFGEQNKKGGRNYGIIHEILTVGSMRYLL